MFDLFCFLCDLPDPIEAVDLKICNDALDDLIGLEAGEGYDDGEFEYERAECRYRQNDEPHKNEVVFEHEARFTAARDDAAKAGRFI